jgi:predicted lipoprotein with Yx(FWY)xxD motif
MSIMIFALAAAAQPPATPPQVQIIQESGVYVMRTLDGSRPIYTFDRDEPGKSNCLDRCIMAWPAVIAPAGAKPVGKWTIIVRSDGTLQWAFESKPAYTFVRDSEGTPSGDGMGGVWHLLPSTPAR